MAWDPALLRKYNTTSHFRLLNQIRTELREQPIQRPLVTTRSAATGFGGGGRRGGRSGAEASTPAGSSLAAGSAGQATGAASSTSASGAGSASSANSLTSSAPSHANTRRRSNPSNIVQSATSSAPRDHQPIVAVPVLTDVVLPDSHA